MSNSACLPARSLPVLVLIDPHSAPRMWGLTAYRGHRPVGQANLDSRGLGPREAAAVIEDYRRAVAEARQEEA